MRILAQIILFTGLFASRVVFALEPMPIRLIGDDAGFSGQVLTRVDALIRQSGADFLIVEADRATAPSSGTRQLIIAIGSKGWRAMDGIAADTPVLAVLPPRQLFDALVTTSGRPMSAIYGEMPPGRVLNFVSILQQKKGAVVSIIAGPQTQLRLPRFEALANEKNIRLIVEKIDREIDVGAAVDRLIQHSEVLLALPDPMAHAASTVSPILMMTYRAGIPVIAYSESYLKAGATAALYATPEQIARQVMDVITAYRQSKSLPPPQYLKYATVGINQAVARSLGLRLPPVDEIELRLRQLKE